LPQQCPKARRDIVRHWRHPITAQERLAQRRTLEVLDFTLERTVEFDILLVGSKHS
jgi:hypothetical protein